MKLAVYFGRLYAAVVLLTLLGLVVLVVAAGLIEGGGQLTHATSPALTALKLGGLRAVEFSYNVLPAAVFLAALVAGTTLARRGELLAVYAAGMARRRVAGIFVGVALVAATLQAWAGERLLPRVIRQIGRVEQEELGRIDPFAQRSQERAAWFRRSMGDLEMVLHLPLIDVEDEEFLSPVVYLRRHGELLEVLSAERLAFVEGRWQLFAGQRLRVRPGGTQSPDSEPFENLSLTLDARPTDLIDIAGDPRQMRSRALRRIIARRDVAQLDSTSHEIVLHDRVVLPTSVLLLVLLAVPWAVSANRQRSLALSLGAGVVTVGAYLSLAYLVRVLALGHQLPLVLGAWGGPLVALVGIPASFWGRRRIDQRGRLW